MLLRVQDYLKSLCRIYVCIGTSYLYFLLYRLCLFRKGITYRNVGYMINDNRPPRVVISLIIVYDRQGSVYLQSV